MYYFIINPNSKSQTGIKLWKKLKERLLEGGVPFREFLTTKPNDATIIARRITEKSKQKNIIILGGDGTLHEVVTGIENFEDVKLGYIPIGSSNDFARGMKLTADIEVLLKQLIEESEYKLLDYGVTRVPDGSGGRFLVSTGIGYDAKICQLANVTKTKKVLNALKLGKLTYIQIGLQGLMKFQMFQAKVIVDGKEIEFEDTLFVSVHNLPYEGGGVMFCPEARPEDGYLDVCVIAGMKKARMLSLLPLAMRGKHVGKKGVYQYRCKKVVIETKEEQYYHMDGEVPGKTMRMEVSVSEDGIQFISSEKTPTSASGEIEEFCFSGSPISD